MVVVHRAHGFRYVIYTQDHDPAHIHIVGGGQAKVNLEGPGGQVELVYVVGISRSDMRRLMLTAEDFQTKFLADWKRIHGT